MPNTASTPYKYILLGVGILVVCIGVLGLADLRNAPWAGFSHDGNYHITRIDQDSPAKKAGFRIGDIIKRIGEIPVEDTGDLARRGRPGIGETHKFEIDRDGEALSLILTYDRQPARTILLQAAYGMVGLFYVGFCLGVYLRFPRTETLLLSLVGICLGLAFLPGPYSGSYPLRTIGQVLITLVVTLGLAFLVHFLMEFPRRKAWLQDSRPVWFIYSPALLVALFLSFRIVFQPQATNIINTITSAMIGLFSVSYFLWACGAMLHTYFQSTPEERSTFGLNFMLFGTVIGLLPAILSASADMIAPQASLPGKDYYFLTLIFIPISFSIAAWRSASRRIS